MDNLDYLIALSLNPIADETAKEFENIDDSGVVISKKTDRKIRKLIRKSAKCSREETAVVTPMPKRFLRRAAVAILVAVSLMFGGIMSISAVRKSLWKAITEWYNEFFSVNYEKGRARMTVPDKIEEIRKPRLLPQGVVEAVVADDSFDKFICDYYIEEKFVMSFSQKLLTKKTNLINGADAEVSYISVNDNEAVLVKNKKGIVFLDWTDGEYEYTIVGYEISADIMLLMAESVG